MSMTYTSLLSDFSEELDPTRLHSVFIPRNAQITVFLTYTGIAQYLEGNGVSHIHLKQTHAKLEGMYGKLLNIGNHGFKQTYLKVYDAYRSHPELSSYVGWMVHL